MPTTTEVGKYVVCDVLPFAKGNVIQWFELQVAQRRLSLEESLEIVNLSFKMVCPNELKIVKE